MKQASTFLLSITFVLTIASCGEKKSSDTASVGKGDATHGQQVYTQTCTPCHGPGGKGDGPAAAALNPKPADHTNKALIGARSDEDLANIIKMGGGIVGKPSMPASPQLSDADVKDVVAFLRQLSGSDHH